jgi:hypothetical protein
MISQGLLGPTRSQLIYSNYFIIRDAVSTNIVHYTSNMGHIRLRDAIFVHCKGKGVTYVLLHNGGSLQPLHHKTVHH